MMRADLTFERAALRDLLHQLRCTRVELAASQARLIADIAQSHELMARADFVLTLPFLRGPRKFNVS